MERDGIFAGDNPFHLFNDWLDDAIKSEPNDPNAIALATVDATGMPNVRMVLLKDILENSFVIYTNYDSVKSKEIEGAGKASFVCHWKSLRRQIRVRGLVTKENGPLADAYFASRSPRSRIGAWASLQSQPLQSRQTLMNAVQRVRDQLGETTDRPPNWGGLRITPTEMEFWADGDARLHDRFRWTRGNTQEDWNVARLYP